MNPVIFGAIFALGLAAAIILLLEVGRRVGARRLAEDRRDRPRDEPPRYSHAGTVS